ncbi:UDP-2,3-diacylglucosamine diphosphatase [Bacteroidota bacterium]
MSTKNIYFASDTHFGFPNRKESLVREKMFVKWLDEIKNHTKELYLLGDIFDFWFEYKKIVPRGFTRLLGKLAEFTDAGIPVHFFCGNHDLWIFDYLPKESGVILHREPLTISLQGKKFYLAHGDGLGPFDKKFKILKKIFTNSLAQWFFARLHPNTTIRIAERWSRSSRNSHGEITYEGPDKEWLIIYARELIKEQDIDFLVFGHRHFPNDLKLNEKSRFINLGDWITNFSYGVFDGNEFYLKSYTDPKKDFKRTL